MENDRIILTEILVERVVRELHRMDIKVTEESLTTVPVSVSGRHVHLTRNDMDVLFGSGTTLTKKKELSQPGQFASNERVTVSGPGGQIDNVRILGPLRSNTQIELSASDARRIGVQPVIRPSGVLDGTPKVTIIGPAGSVETNQGCIVAERHIHMTPSQAEIRGLRDGQEVKVEINGSRGGILDHVRVRVNPDYAWDMHIDTDEANALQVGAQARGKIIYDDSKSNR